MRELILGGARSGKSALAERRAHASGLPVTYLATGEAGDAEMAARIAAHRARRPAGWALVEEPLALAAALAGAAEAGRCVVIDCLALWLSNLLHADERAPGIFAAEREALLAALPGLPGEIVLVSNEVGCGIVPLNPLARRFRDEAGWLNQAVAERCDRVTLVAAGLPLTLKGESP